MVKRNLTQRQVKFLFASGILSRGADGKRSVSFNKDRSQRVNEAIKGLVRAQKANVADIGVKRARNILAKEIVLRRQAIRKRSRNLSMTEVNKKLAQSRKVEQSLLSLYKPFLKKK